VSSINQLLAYDLQAVSLANSTGTINKLQLIDWVQAYCDDTGTMRLDLVNVMPGSQDSVGAEIIHTAFQSNLSVTINSPHSIMLHIKELTPNF
jgi:hypothetical protein